LIAARSLNLATPKSCYTVFFWLLQQNAGHGRRKSNISPKIKHSPDATTICNIYINRYFMCISAKTI
jgi:hypothetical protein